MGKRNSLGTSKQFEPINSIVLIYLRVSVLSIVLFMLTWYQAAYSEVVSEALYLIVAIFFGLAAIAGIFLNHIKPGKIFTVCELAVHSTLVTLIVYNTGLAGSPWIFLYFPLIMVSALLVNRSSALFLGLFSVGTYYLAIQNQQYSWLDLPLLSGPIMLSSAALKLQLLSLVSGMALVSIGMTFLKTRLRNQFLELMTARQEINSLSTAERDLLNSINHGVIVIDEQFNLKKVNDFAKTILGLSERRKITSEDIFTLLPEVVAKLKLGDLSAVELTLPESEHRLNCKITESFSSSGKSYLIVLNDLTEIQNVLQQLDVQNEMARLLAQPKQVSHLKAAFENKFIGQSKKMQQIFNTIKKVAPVGSTVLITGESGTGKELVASSIHEASERSGDFVAVNCGAIPEGLIESQLFGHRKGSFTGATSDHKGFFQQAENGTIFLDEIGELPLHLQTKLLRVIQEMRIRPVGAENDLPINVRIVAATNKNLASEVQQGSFREDLFFRLNVISVSLPALRERKEDIPLLIDFMLKKFTKGESQPLIPPDTMKILMKYSYPGNIRELENIIEHAYVFGGDVILPEHLPEHLVSFDRQDLSMASETQLVEQEDIDLEGEFELDAYLQEIERKYLEAALEESEGIKTKAAEKLGLNFRSFRYRLDKFGIE